MRFLLFSRFVPHQLHRHPLHLVVDVIDLLFIFLINYLILLFKLYAEERQSQAVLTILDNGPGIPENRLEAIFQRFYSERPKGESFGDHSGLGLSIARQIVIGHGGSLLASNRDSGGARFTLTLPLA